MLTHYDYISTEAYPSEAWHANTDVPVGWIILSTLLFGHWNSFVGVVVEVVFVVQ